MRVVFDANVVASAVCWSGEAYLCLIKMARRQVFAFGTDETLEETRAVASELIREIKPRHNATGRLTWYLDKLRLVTSAPVGKQRARDMKDDSYIGAALACKAIALITYDRDLLVREKPFGIPIITPAQLLKAVKG